MSVLAMGPYGGGRTEIKRICVVGAGPGGQAASKYLLAEDCFESIDIFEQQASFGGVWNYSSDHIGTIDIPQTNPHQPVEEPIGGSVSYQSSVTTGKQPVTFASPMYEQLETNIPHSIMKFSDKSSLEDHQVFPRREAVAQYLEDYGEDIRHLVSFQTQVTDICQTPSGAHQVQLKDLQTNTVYEKIYDAILVANGHYTVPLIPDIKGMKEWNQANPGVISHTKNYRRPAPFVDKKVLVVGNAASGTDIASQIGAVSKYPLLMSQRSESSLAVAASYKDIVPEIAEFLPESYGQRAIRFADGRVEEEVDAVLFATGYYYSFPFLSSIEPQLISTGERVQHLYRHIFYMDDPTIAFIGLPAKIIPFRTMEGQGAVIARVWARTLELPSKVEMSRWEEDNIAEFGTGKTFHVLQFPRDFEYHNELVDWATRASQGGKMPKRWSAEETWLRERFPNIKKAFADKGEARHDIKTIQALGFDYEAWLREQPLQI